ncbi:hypothetical protein LptCag_1559 [Leptospirillum ferriphilum]|uniref:Uncharacterized protein n=1 Tax=Leptospirillum ferriphilum TaxID=178606 RepID=A0A094X5M2_9BACT|nr:hypothetical protein LptCag_1559 [Leptospirillum ferriphilum]
MEIPSHGFHEENLVRAWGLVRGTHNGFRDPERWMREKTFRFSDTQAKDNMGEMGLECFVRSDADVFLV